ncbi:beta-1,4-glucuronyltransferase 1 [Nerophis lumbriciformis]|uniref:beta-1,4-glucuronyltransferase 1 n=1 Tax=Nerophis lumbriciformis TaxID=546530 RepID=UPI003BA88912
MHLSKKCSAFRVVLSALLLVALLQLLYLSFLSKFHGKQQRYRYSELFGGSRPENVEHPERNSRKERLRYSLSTGGIFDNSGQYRVYKNLIKSEQNPANNVLTLATHASINNLHHLEALVERWQNPLSVAIFAHGQDVKFGTALVYALSVLCPQVQALVDFHLVCLSGETASFPEQDHQHFAGLDDCAAVFSRLDSHRDKYKNYVISGNISYPNNLLRNVARGGAESSYILVMDMDMMPSADLHRDFLAMVERREPVPNQVFVLPAFEIRHARKIPATKAELVQLYQVGEVRPFYEELCTRCQAPTNYSRWVNGHVRGSDALEVAYTLTWTDPWEPFYIGPRGVPLYDESFKQYGFNRISQACELHVAGYRFSVLNSAFLVHRGFKIQGEFHAKKDEENKRNRLLFRSFKEALKSKYPSSSRRC